MEALLGVKLPELYESNASALRVLSANGEGARNAGGHASRPSTPASAFLAQGKVTLKLLCLPLPSCRQV